MSINNWDHIEKAANKGPLSIGFMVIAVVVVLGGGIGVISYVGGWFGEAAQVTREEVGPRALLRKYEWFKNAAAELDKKQADIQVYSRRLTNMEKDYEGIKRKDWDRTDKEQFNQWQVELAGVKASYNGLAAEYNAQMAKINWRFANIGDLPEGATEPLPREFRGYEGS